MPYTLITGLPGSCKSLMAIDMLRSKEFAGRPLFVSGVPALKLPHQKLDPNEVEEGGDLLQERKIDPLIDLPQGALIFIDECQRVFPPRASTREPPPNVRYFEVHRKKGHDGILVTQHPNLLDPNVRKLVGRHLHVVRTLGLQRATVYEWNKCKDPDSKADLKLAISRSYTFPQDVYPLYKSAELHTIKARIPKLVFIIPALLIGGCIAAYLGVSSIQKNTRELGEKNGAPIASKTGTLSQPAQRDTGSKPSYLDPVADAKQFVFDRTPRVAGLPHTAPRYDSITAPTAAPVPVSCVATASKCKCYSQQATAMDVDIAVCRDIVERGYFRDFNDGTQQQNASIVNERKDIQPMQPITHTEPSISAPAVSADHSRGYGVLGARRDGVRVPGV